MKKQLSKKISVKFLFFSFIFLSYAGKAFGEWSPPPSPELPPISFREYAIDRIETFIIFPFLIFGLIMYCFYSYYKIVKKNNRKAHTFFNIGTWSIIIAISSYILMILCCTFIFTA